MMFRFEPVPPHSEKILNNSVNRKGPLRLIGRLETSHLSFSLPSRFVRNLREVVGVLIGVMVHRRNLRPQRRPVTLQFIGDHS